MKRDDLFSALSFVDDELTERAHKIMQGEHKHKKTKRRKVSTKLYKKNTKQTLIYCIFCQLTFIYFFFIIKYGSVCKRYI